MPKNPNRRQFLAAASTGAALSFTATSYATVPTVTYASAVHVAVVDQLSQVVAAVRHPLHVLDAALAGSDVCTMFFDTLKQLYDHPLTDLGVDMFLKDWAKATGAAQ